MPTYRKLAVDITEQAEFINLSGVESQLIWVLLPTVCDKAGRTHARPATLCGALFPHGHPTINEQSICNALDELERAGSIVRYSIGRAMYLQISGWADMQGDCAKEGSSKIPAPELGQVHQAQELVHEQVLAKMPEPISEKPAPAQNVSTEPKAPRERATKKAEPLTADMAEHLAADAQFCATWHTWVDERAARGKKLTPQAAKLQLQQLAQLTASAAIQCVNESIASGWQGVFVKNYIADRRNLHSTKSRKTELERIPPHIVEQEISDGDAPAGCVELMASPDEQGYLTNRRAKMSDGTLICYKFGEKPWNR